MVVVEGGEDEIPYQGVGGGASMEARRGSVQRVGGGGISRTTLQREERIDPGDPSDVGDADTERDGPTETLPVKGRHILSSLHGDGAGGSTVSAPPGRDFLGPARTIQAKRAIDFNGNASISAPLV